MRQIVSVIYNITQYSLAKVIVPVVCSVITQNAFAHIIGPKNELEAD